MRTYLNFISSLVVTLAMVQTANSDIVVSLTNEIDAAGTNATVTISIADTEGSSSLEAFNFAIDIGSDNAVSSQSDFDFLGASALAFESENLRLGEAIAGSNFDLTAANSGTGITLSETPTELLSLDFLIDSSVPTGTTFPVSLQAAPSVSGFAIPGLFALTLDSTPIESNDAAFGDVVTVANGTITVAATVPEPSGIALLAVGACGIAARRRRRNA